MSPDLEEPLRAFSDGGVEHLVVGAHAAHGHVRARNKRASGRLQDLADVERIERGDED